MRSYMEKPTYISSTGVIMDQYVPVEGDGKASLISLTGTKQVKTCILYQAFFFYVLSTIILFYLKLK